MTSPPTRPQHPVFSAGGVTVYLFNGGDFPIDLAEVYGDATKNYFGSTKSWFPSNSMLITTEGANIVVDPGDSARLAASSDPTPDPVRFRPVHVVDQMERIGVGPSEVTHVVVTHLHTDHFLGTTRAEGGKRLPTFPNARHIIPRRDWEMPDIAAARGRGDIEIASTLGVIEGAGLVDLVDGRLEIGPHVAVVPFPGESPGHQVIRVSAGDKACYCIGDLYHAKEEVVHPELVAVWTDRDTLAKSKAAFSKVASSEGALILSGHMNPGRISLTKEGVRWADVSAR